MLYTLSFIISILTIFGCSQTPDIPSLPGPGKKPIEQVILSQDISVRDVRNLFRALNQAGRLNSLKPWFESSTDSELKELGAFATRNLYDENFDKNGLVSLLESRIKRQGFSDIKQNVSDWKKNAGYPQQKAFVESFVRQPQFPDLIEGDTGLLDPSFARTVQRTKQVSQSNYKAFATFPESTPVTDAGVADDLMKFITGDALRGSLTTLIDLLTGNDFAASALKALQALNNQYGDSRPADGFAMGMSTRLTDKKLESFFLLLNTLNSGSDGLFKIADEKMQSNHGIGQELSKRFNPTIAKAVAQFVIETLSSKQGAFTKEKAFWIALPRKAGATSPTPEFVTLFNNVQSGISLLRSQTHGPNFAKFPITLASLVITEWLENFAFANLTQLNALPTEGFKKSFWQTSVAVPAFRLSLIQEPDPKKENALSNRLQNDLDALKALSSFRDALQSALKDPNFGSKAYLFPEQKNGSLENALLAATGVIQEKTQIVDPGPFFLALLQTLIGSDGNPGSPLAGFERENMLDSILNSIQAMKYSEWKSFKSLIFDKLKLGTLSQFDRDLVLQLYEGNQPLIDKLNNVFDSLQSLYDYDESIQGLPSAFETCHTLLRKTAPDNVHGFGSLAPFLFQNKIVHVDENTNLPEFPALYTVLKNGRSLSELFFRLSNATPAEQSTLLNAFKNLDFKKHLDLLATLAKESPENTREVLKAVSKSGLDLLPSETVLTEGERIWLMRFFSKEGEHRQVWNFLNHHSSKKNLTEFLKEVSLLSKNGGLKDAFELLSHVENDRIKRLALVLMDWDRSGQLQQFLDASSMLLND